MKRFLAIGVLVLLVAALVATPAAAGKGKAYSKVKGQVIKVEEQVRTANGGVSYRLTVRTRNGNQLQLHLGEGGACAGCFQEGDRIRARVQALKGPAGQYGVQSMKVRRGGEMYGYVNANGELVRQRSGRYGSGADRIRDREHQPGSGVGPGQRTRSGGGPGRGGHGGGGGGGRGHGGGA